MYLRALIMFLLVVGAPRVLSAESPDEGVRRVEKFWSEKANGVFIDAFWDVSYDVAKQHGLAVIDPVLQRSPKWEGEEGLIYVPLLALLPRAEAIGLLKRYEQSAKEPLNLYAREFLIEFEAEDVAYGVRETVKRKEKRPNQALQTTPMTRSVYDKTIEFGRRQRGV